MRAHGSPAAPVSPAVEGTLVEHARRDEDPPGPYDLPPGHFRRLERRHARIGPQVLGGGVEAAQLGRRPAEFGLGPQPEVGLGAFVAHLPKRALSWLAMGRTRLR